MKKIPLFQPYVNDAARENVQRVLSGTQLAEGPEVEAFEREFADQFGFEPSQVVALNSGTAALELAYDLADIDAESQVISPVLTCTATNIPLVRRGARIIFGDVDGMEHLNLSPSHVSRILEKFRGVSALVFVHFGGSSAGLEEIESLATRAGVDLICDAAQALGAPLSRVARFNCISLQAIKSLTSGDGGILICRDRVDADMARKLRWFGYDRAAKHRGEPVNLALAGYKFHMNDISAAIGRGNLRDWYLILERRQAINAAYRRAWSHRDPVFQGARLVEGIWNPCVLGMDYAWTRERMAAKGIEVGQHHQRNDVLEIFSDEISECPRMDELGEGYFLLPCHMGMDADDAFRIGRELWG